jgi:catechol 2,3-dioxygenase-like lactoylglutathione lyase family enzyme
VRTKPASSALHDMWNMAIKVRDLDAELEFLKACGATDIIRDKVATETGDEEFAMLKLGPERILLFAHLVYEPELSEPMHYGLTHAVYEVEDLDKVLEEFAVNGILPIWGPTEVSASFGHRRIAFFRSPSGFVFEAMQPLRDGAAL